MARKVKFPLIMKDGVEVRTLDELKENFDVEKVVSYFNDGRLLTWLQSRYYEDEADKIEQLEKNDPQLQKKICAIFDVEPETEEIDVEEIARRTERLNRLKQYTDDREIWERVDQVAFDQEDLSDLLDEDATLIYLCSNKFTVPLRETHKTYIGIGKAIAVIRSNKVVDFDALNIEFKNVIFDDMYKEVLKKSKIDEQTQIIEEKAKLPKKIYEEGKNACDYEDYETAMEKYRQAAELDYPAAFGSIGHLYLCGHGVDKNVDEARRWLKLGMEKKDEGSFFWYIETFRPDKNLFNIISTEAERRTAFNFVRRLAESDDENTAAIYGLAHCYEDGIGVVKDSKKALEFYEQAANAGDVLAMSGAARLLENGTGVRKNINKAIEWYQKAAEAGDEFAYYQLGEIYLDEYINMDDDFRSNIYGDEKRALKDNQKAGVYFRKGADAGNILCMWRLADMCERGLGMAKDENLAFRWHLRAAEAGDSVGMAEVGKRYLEGRGTKKNLREAEYWLSKSASKGSGMKEYADLLFEKNESESLDWYKKAFEDCEKKINDSSSSYEKERAGEIAYKIYKIFKEGKCGVTKNRSEADYWEQKYKSLGYNSKEGSLNSIKSTVSDFVENKPCFITTAVCDSFDKPDDCFELTTFR